MTSPIDYSIDVQTPFQSALQGYQAGAAIRNDQLQQQQQQLALQQKQQQAQVLQSLISNPNAGAADYSRAMTVLPGIADKLKAAWDTKNTDQQQSHLSDLTQWGAALQNGQPQIAVNAMKSRADAMESSAGGPTPESQALRANAGAIEAHPNFGLAMIKAQLAAFPGGGNVIDGIVKQGQEQRAQDQAPADLATKQADATLKNLTVIGQTLGSLQGKNVKPEQVATAFKSLAAKGVIPKGELPDYLDSIPQDPKELPGFLETYKMAGMKPEDQMKYTTPDANTRANNQTQLNVQGMINKRVEERGAAEATLDPETLTTMANQYLAGDKSVMQNLGRGAQGAANIVALRQEITRQAKAQGLSGPAIASKMAEFAGTMAGQRTAGNRIANIEIAANEAQSLIPLARQASEAVARSGLLPFGKAQIMFDNQTNDPAMRRFAAANNSLVNVYARAISPSGVPTVADKEHAREMLSTAMDHKSYLAVLDQMQKEITAARKAPQAVREAFKNDVTGQGGGTAQPGIPAGWSVQVH